MKTVAITGPFASDLDKIKMICDGLNYPFFEADLVIKYLLNWREDIIRDIKIQMGGSVFKDGFLDSSKFKTTQKFDRLIDVIDVELFLMWTKFVKSNSEAPLVVFKSHIVFERGWRKHFDKIIYLDKPDSKRVDFIYSGGDMRYIDVYSSLDKELSSKKKMDSSDFVIHVNDDLSILTQLANIAEVIKKKDESPNKSSRYAVGHA